VVHGPVAARPGQPRARSRGGVEWTAGDGLSEEDLRRRLTAARYEHSLRVARTAEGLARRHGEDPERARLAGLYHDWARDLPEAELLACAARLGLSGASPAVLHGPVAARLLPPTPGVDEQVRAAVDRHTTGAPGMSRLDMVVYLADLIEPGRAFPGVEEMRRLADEDLEGATLAAMDATLRYLIDRGLPLDPRGVAARNDLLARVRGPR
jgi:predicted HD superfamily hydrolase involved in NAD metabolism